MVGNNKMPLDEAILKLQDDDVATRKIAIKNLEGITDESAIIPLIEATKDENSVVRFAAAEILGEMGETAIDKLIEDFNAESGANKRFLAFALQKAGNKKAIDSFADAVSDEDFGVRKVAVRALGELQAADKLDVMAKGLKDDDWGVRLATVYGLGDLATPESVALIKKARRDEKEKDFKKSCNKALKKADKIIKNGGKVKPASKGQALKTIKEMEKQDSEAAIKAYNVHVKEKSSSDVPYKRLAILYRKLNDMDGELAVLNDAITNLSKLNPGKEDWFQKRLDKLNG